MTLGRSKSNGLGSLSMRENASRQGKNGSDDQGVDSQVLLTRSRRFPTMVSLLFAEEKK